MNGVERQARVALNRLARLHGIQLSYTDVTGRRRRASEGALVQILRALGEPLEMPEDAVRLLPRALRQRWDGRLEPVTVVWNGRGGRALLRIPAQDAKGRWSGSLRLEDGRMLDLEWDLGHTSPRGSMRVDGEPYRAVPLPLPGRLPLGYHCLRVDGLPRPAEGLVLSAPERAYEPPPTERRWGVFVPLHALASDRSWGLGDYTDLADLAAWVGERGGSVVGTLPLLTTFLGRIYDPSPYAPVSRLFWNEAFLDVVSLAGREAARTAARDLEAVRASPLVDYAGVAELKRAALAAGPWPSPPHGEDPELGAYAAFRAATEAAGEWTHWPAAAAATPPPLPPVRREDAASFEGAQRAAEAQLTAASREAGTHGVQLYLDLPIGVSAAGFDVWRWPEVFARGVTAGAPPDTVFTSGQDWGFPPPHPEGMRRDGYRYFAAVLRRQMEIASVLRLDHVMGLHRLFWIPRGAPATEGVYVHYAAEELYAVLTLESTRHACVVVGENLGTVPGYVNESLHRHGICPLYVVEYVTEGPSPRIPTPVPPGTVASVNTHDMAPFAAYWAGRDLDQRAEAGLLPKEKVAAERLRRAGTRDRMVRTLTRGGWLQGTPTPRSVFDAVLALLAASDAWLVLVNLEDLWGETEPQNLPGTGQERPNWRRRLRRSFAEIREDPGIARALRRIDRIRKRQITYPNHAR